MPVYEYQCSACSRGFEYQQRMSDPDKTTCEVCGGALERLISRTAFALKGGGWYKDLYASPKPAEAKTDAKPDAGTAKADAPAAGGDKPAAAPSAAPSGGTSSGGSSNTGGGNTGGGSSNTGGGSASSSSAAAAKVP
jgi:putative FmdB family regulatory protein